MCDGRVVVCFGDYAEEEVEMIVSGRGDIRGVTFEEGNRNS